MTVPDLTPPNPARSLFAKVTKSLFGRKKNKSELEVAVGRGVSEQGWQPCGWQGHGAGHWGAVSSPLDKNRSEERDEVSRLVSGLVRTSIGRQEAMPEVSFARCH